MTSVRTHEGGVTIASPKIAPVEFLPRVPCSYYRIEAEIRHDHSAFRMRGYIGTGVVFSGKDLVAPNGTHHVPGLLWFNGGATPGPLLPGQEPPKRLVSLHLFWYREANDAEAASFVSRNWTAQDGAVYHSDEGGGRWRTIWVDVEPARITARAQHLPGKILGPFMPYEYRQFPRSLRETQAEVRDIDLSPIDRRIVGVLVQGGQCIIRRLRVIPQPKPTS